MKTEDKKNSLVDIDDHIDIESAEEKSNSHVFKNIEERYQHEWVMQSWSYHDKPYFIANFSLTTLLLIEYIIKKFPTSFIISCSFYLLILLISHGYLVYLKNKIPDQKWAIYRNISYVIIRIFMCYFDMKLSRSVWIQFEVDSYFIFIIIV